METDVFFVREWVLTKQLMVHHIPALDQWADTLTQPLSPARFFCLKGKLNVLEPPPKASTTLSLQGGIGVL